MHREGLLTRGEFRRSVLERDGYTCVFCTEPAQDAHHILERKLWDDGGYYIDNGASVCGKHHIDCESTIYSVDDVRAACGIVKPILPEHLYSDQVYDKWGNVVCEDGKRLKGELFFDEGFGRVIDRSVVFVDYVKYPRTYHLPWSPGVTGDDKVMKTLEHLEGRQVVVTEKMDGENTSLYRDHVHARSIDSGNHPSRNWVKNFWGGIASDIPRGWRICGENLFAKHSIGYSCLESYFLGFSIWDGENNCLSWDETMEWFELLGVSLVPVLYRGEFDVDAIRCLSDKMDFERSEGYVVRTADGFSCRGFRGCVGKYVRAEHCRTAKHWMHGQRIVKNGLL